MNDPENLRRIADWIERLTRESVPGFGPVERECDENSACLRIIAATMRGREEDGV